MKPFSHYISRKILAVLILMGGYGSTAIAQDLKAAIPTDSKVVKGKFANGLTYYIRPNAKPEKKVELRLVINAGSILEDNDQQGLAHFMEHMNFNGSKNFPKNELVSYLQSIGVEFGADLNAYTSFDETVYILPVPTDKAGNLDKGFQIIEDWAHNALLTNKDIDDERAVVLEESRLGKGAEMRMLDKYLPKLMMGSQYASRLPIGKDDILKNFKYETIRRFYSDWYRPDLMAVAIVGDIDEATAMKYLKKHFEGMKNPAKERERKAFEVPARKAAEAMVLTDKEATSYQLQLIFPSVKKLDEKTVGDYRENIERQLVTQMLNRRMSDLARSSNPPFPYAYVGFDGWARDYENFSAATSFGADGPEKALNALTAELLRAKQYGFTNSELELAKKGVMSFIEKAYNERNTTESGNIVGEYVRNFLENEPIPGIEAEYEYYKQMVPGITLEEMNANIKAWMSNMNFFSLITGPEQGAIKLPTDAELLAMTQKGFSQEVKAMEEKKVASSLLDKKPTPGKVVSKADNKDFGVTTLTLSNGIKVTIKPTDFKSDEIIVKGLKKGGLSNYGVADKYSAKYAGAVVGSMGFGSFNPTDLEKVIAGKSIKAGAGLGENAINVSGTSTVKDFETMLQLMYLKLMQPRKDDALFKAFKDKQKMQLQFLSANPQYSFIDTLVSALYNKNPLADEPIPKPAHFEAINLDRSLEIYKNEVSNADGYEFFIVGNVKVDEITPLVETYLGSLPSTGKTPKVTDNGVRPINGATTLRYKKGKEKQSLIIASFYGERPYSEKLEMKADALTEILNIKVIEELREKMGGTYSGGFGAQFEKDPYNNYSIQYQLPCGPENVDKLIKATKEVIAEIKKNGPDPKDLEKVKATWHEQHREEVKDNNYWSIVLPESLFWNRYNEYVLQHDKMIDQLTVNDVKEVANDLMDGKNEFWAILYPES